MSHYDDIYLHDTAREESEAEQDRINRRLAQLLADRGAVLAADAKAEVRTPLADLHTIPPCNLFGHELSLPGMDVIAGLYQLAKQEHANRIAALTEMAEADVAEAAAFRPEQDEAA